MKAQVLQISINVKSPFRARFLIETSFKNNQPWAAHLGERALSTSSTVYVYMICIYIYMYDHRDNIYIYIID